MPTPQSAQDLWKQRWITVAPSEFAWEEEALQCLKRTFAGHGLLAWSNFQFITQEGNIYEVDLLLLTRAGLYLIEIKSWPGTLTGDTHTWVLTREDRSEQYLDNPLLLANRKTKSLKSLIQVQPSFRNRRDLRIPFVQPIVFLSNTGLDNKLNDLANAHVYTHADTRGLPGTLPRMVTDLAMPRAGCAIGLPVEKALVEALARAGVRRPNRAVRVGDYQLERLLDEGPGWQDRLAKHTSIDLERRVRQYMFSSQKSDEERLRLRRAARREFEITESIRHPNVLRALEFREHENGPALIYEYDEKAVRLDHAVKNLPFDLDTRLQIVRQVAEVLAYAHSRKVLHRALSPRSVLLGAGRTVTVMNWQTAVREGTTAGQTGTVHVCELVEDDGHVYIAPEALRDATHAGTYSDIFSLGALTHFVVTGQAPAPDRLALDEILRTQQGLLPSSACDGVHPQIDELVQMCTRPDVSTRVSSVGEFLVYLSAIEEKLASPAETEVNPLDAMPGDVLTGGFTLVRRLGRGSVSLALLVNRDEEEFVLKVAHTSSDNEMLEHEAAALGQLHDRHVVRLYEKLDMSGHAGLLLSRAGETTLAERLQKDGPLNLDLLERLGADLLDTLIYLEAKGIHHRDIKPANLGVNSLSKKQLELVLFDFSLSRASLDNIRAGTAGYLDPFLSLRRPPRWDLHAERYAAAVTLYEMATGRLPRWGDGISDPALTDATLVLEPELLDSSVRESLAAFFRRALERDPGSRYDNAEDMRQAWRAAFAAPQAASEATPSAQAEVTLDTPVALLGLPPAQLQAVDRLGAMTVRDLLEVPSRQIVTMRGVGNDARRALADRVAELRERFAHIAAEEAPTTGTLQGLDPIVRRLLDAKLDARLAEVREALWNAADGDTPTRWPSSAELGSLTSADASAGLTALAGRWAREESVEALSTTVFELLEAHGGVMQVDELAAGVLSARGSVQVDHAVRARQARFATRAAIDAEATVDEPRFALRRVGAAVLVAVGPELATYAADLGRIADELAMADPLVAPQRALQTLRDVQAPDARAPLSDHRLLRLAAACSAGAALSSRQELYPRGMPARRALVLAHGSLLGASELKPSDIQERVRSRYDAAEALPGRPELDTLLKDARWDFDWYPEGGVYLRRQPGMTRTSSTTFARLSTTEGTRGPVSEAVAGARLLEERLHHAQRDGAFLVLAVKPPRMRMAESELTRRFDVEPLWLDEALIGEMRRLAAEYEARWDVVIDTDADPHHPDRRNLLQLAREALNGVEARIRSSKRTVLVSRAGLVARYGLMDRLEALRDAVGRRDGLFGLWLLVPCDESQAVPTLDGQAIPLMAAAQHARLSEAWLQNLHRARAEAG